MRRDKEKSDHGYEVSTARGRLEGALQVLIDRTESETSDESDVDVTDVLQEGRRSTAGSSPSTSPRKIGSHIKTPMRKRRRLNLDKAIKSDQQTYVLKLYDRSVDLAQFSPNTPLYPVCRAWIKNQPNNPSVPSRKTLYSRGFSPRKMDDKSSEKDDIKTEDKESEVKYLPLPDPMPLNAAGNRIDSRIPENLKPPEKLSSLDFLNQESGPSVQTLLSEHLSHWWDVRRQWRQAAATNESRYARSTSILKTILVRP